MAARARSTKGQVPPQVVTVESVNLTTLRDENLTTRVGKAGVAPVGKAVLHVPTTRYAGPTNSMKSLAERMERTMQRANGIALAANQVGAGLRALFHNLPQCPPFLLNPLRIAGKGAVARPLNVVGSQGKVIRWKQITVVADLNDDHRIVIEADEMLARVLQHELDHLDGIEYVQRMSGNCATGRTRFSPLPRSQSNACRSLDLKSRR